MHRRLAPVSLHAGFLTRPGSAGARTPNHFLVLCSDGLQDLYADAGVAIADLPKVYLDAIVHPSPSALLSNGVAHDSALFAVEDNLALRLLRHALGGDDYEAVSQLLQGEPDEEAWIDDVTIVVQVL